MAVASRFSAVLGCREYSMIAAFPDRKFRITCPDLSIITDRMAKNKPPVAFSDRGPDAGVILEPRNDC